MNHQSHVLVIGGSGFVGTHLIQQLNHFRVASITNFDIRNDSIFESDKDLSHVEFVKGSINDELQLLKEFNNRNIDTIFHCATPPPFAPDKVLKMVNIEGTEALLKASQRSNHVKRIILVSSSSVVYDGGNVLNATEENTPYAQNGGYNTYTSTKIAQEKRVLEFDEKNEKSIRTVALRPAAIFGPRDPLFFPSVAEQALKGRLKIRVGDGSNLYSFTYVRNVAKGLILAARKIEDHGVGGEAFFLTNDEDMPFWDMLSGIAKYLESPTPKFDVPYKLYWFICIVMAFVVYLLNWIPKVNIEVPVSMSFDKLSYLTSTRTFSCEKAKKRLGYEPIPMKQALEETYESFRHLKEGKKTK
eukprot:CAMPEP_0117439332 /NCGR_PEP_ID=MMETSP0759-20121206/2511_1 /TAXON_ID=63605 /ORGANISM="Percolomonas cosmopolitus, Strain WS" /LENGTH=357 /DNA_ID=CAMNT_0005231045 /DNA_START=125 /DNA_END=1198 /DNA_ORIENTATION=+